MKCNTLPGAGVSFESFKIAFLNILNTERTLKMLNNFNLKNLLNFDVMLFPRVARICYIVLAVISVLFGVGLIMRGIDSPWGGGLLVLSGLFTMILAPLFIRLWFEMILVVFMIYEYLRDIRKTLTKQTDTQH